MRRRSYDSDLAIDRTTDHIDKARALAKHDLIEALMEFVFGSPWKAWKARIDQLIERYNTCMSTPITSIAYRGEIYFGSSTYYGRHLVNHGPLPPSLQPEMAELARQFRALEDEQSKVRPYFVTVVNATPHPQHYRSLLPECIHAALPPVPLGKEPLPMAQKEIDHILQLNAGAIHMIKRRLAMNLIC